MLSLGLQLREYMPIGGMARQAADCIGVEVELEGINVRTNNPDVLKYWKVHDDGSLRVMTPDGSACEYVFKGPMRPQAARNAIDALYGYLTSDVVDVYDSYRTSIHVHVNCGLDTIMQVYNYLTLAIIFDELFTSQNGEHRIGNNFCLRAVDAEGLVTDLIDTMDMRNGFLAISQNHRYSTINVASLRKFGTIEFRSLECTTDKKRLLHWIDTLLAMKQAARGFKSPRDIIVAYSVTPTKEFVRNILGECADKYLAVAGWDGMLYGGVRLAQDLAFSREWVDEQQGEDGAKPIKKVGLKPVGFGEAIAAAQLAQAAQMIDLPGLGPQWDILNNAAMIELDEPEEDDDDEEEIVIHDEDEDDGGW